MIQNWMQKLLFLAFVILLCFAVAGFRNTETTNLKHSVYFGQGLSILEQTRDRFVYKELLTAETMTVLEGENMAEKLRDANIDTETQLLIIDKLNPVFPLNKISVGQEIIVLWNNIDADTNKDVDNDAETRQLVAINIPIDSTEYLLLEAENDFEPQKRTKSLVTKIRHVDGIINTNFSEAAQEFDIPTNIHYEYLELMSFDISFQQDIRVGTEFAILFEELYDNKGNLVGHGNIWMATLKLYDDREFTYYRYQNQDGEADYYARDGKTARKSLLKSPVNSRISSGFGLRRHPILGYTRQHKGIDFAAPEGTFIKAAGDGRIVARNYNRNGYGRYLIIQHAGSYSTMYAHMYGFGRNRADGDRRIREGKTVKQGDVIGRVGSTGLSTGPHLHYEIRRNNRQINPLTQDFKPSAQLKDVEYTRFLESSLYLDHISKFEDESDVYGFNFKDWLRYRKYIAAIRGESSVMAYY